MKLLFVINPVSGGKKKHDWEASIRNYFKAREHSIEFFMLTGKNDFTSIQHHIAAVKPDRVIAVGGDGTIKMLAAILKETQIPLAIMPAGSANGMAKELNIPPQVDKALQIVTDGECRKIDMVKINEEELCIHLSDVGLNAMLIKYYEQSETRGWTSYAKALLRVLWIKQKFRCTIKTDDQVLKRKAYMIVIANASQYGTGGTINPKGCLTDGCFEVVIVRKLNVFAVLAGILKHKSFDPKKIEVVRTKNVELSMQKNHHFQVDGEYLGKTAAVKARILPRILNIMVPRENNQ